MDKATQRWDPSHEPVCRISPGRAATRRGFPSPGCDDTQFPRWRGDAAAPRMMTWGSVRGRHVRIPRFSAAVYKQRLLAFQAHYQAVAKPFKWRFTRQDLAALIEKLHAKDKAA